MYSASLLGHCFERGFKRCMAVSRSRDVLRIENISFIFTVACALSADLKLIGYRFLAGIAECAPLSNEGSSTSNLSAKEDRGTSMAL